MRHRQVRLLFRKEIRQLTRSRGALVPGVMLPALLMVLAPLSQLLASSAGRQRAGTAADVQPYVGLRLRGVASEYLDRVVIAQILLERIGEEAAAHVVAEALEVVRDAAAHGVGPDPVLR